MNWYLDSSAILKLIFSETESPALKKAIKGELFTSVISRIEVVRNVRRVQPESIATALEVLTKINYLPVNTQVLASAELLAHTTSMKSLDSLHIASLITCLVPMAALITYDKNMAASAKGLGLTVTSPT